MELIRIGLGEVLSPKEATVGGVSSTVKAHVTAIMRKLGVQSRTQAVLVAQDAKFASVLPRLH